MKDYEKLEDARSHLAERESRYLRKRGWEHTSKTPHYRWMWAKEWDGKQLLVSREDALAIQGFIDSRT